MLPAPGQGALAVERRADDEELRALLGRLDDDESRTCVTAERALLAALRAGCTAPVGAHATIVRAGEGSPTLGLDAVVAPDSTAGADAVAVRMSATGSPGAPEELGHTLAADLLASGAAALLGESS
jgi:hydroxymethylbilane synthase